MTEGEEEAANLAFYAMADEQHRLLGVMEIYEVVMLAMKKGGARTWYPGPSGIWEGYS